MKILVVSATAFEIAATLGCYGHLVAERYLGAPGAVYAGESVDFLISGVGPCLSGIHITEQLSETRYDLVLQAGLAGSFSEAFPKRSVVRVTSEVFADVGAEDNGSFLTLGQMGLLAEHAPPFTEGRLLSPELPNLAFINVPVASSVTVNRVLSEKTSIEWIKQQFYPDVVNMEGAALFYVLRKRKIPFVSLRAISDFVGPRDTSSWDIPGAVSALNNVLSEALVRLVADAQRPSLSEL